MEENFNKKFGWFIWMADIYKMTGVNTDHQLQWDVFKFLNWCGLIKTKSNIEEMKMVQWRASLRK